MVHYQLDKWFIKGMQVIQTVESRYKNCVSIARNVYTKTWSIPNEMLCQCEKSHLMLMVSLNKPDQLVSSPLGQQN